MLRWLLSIAFIIGIFAASTAQASTLPVKQVQSGFGAFAPSAEQAAAQQACVQIEASAFVYAPKKCLHLSQSKSGVHRCHVDVAPPQVGATFADLPASCADPSPRFTIKTGIERAPPLGPPRHNPVT